MSADNAYAMDRPKRGRFVIINNENFQPATGMRKRNGTQVDAVQLDLVFKWLGFEVVTYKDTTASQMVQIMASESELDHSDFDCFGAAILTHGGDQGVLFGVDGITYIDNLLEPIKSCRGLVGKPKLFFFQACRGEKLDTGIQSDSGAGDVPKSKPYIPMEADFLYTYSTPPGHYSWRNGNNGSWFIQSLCEQLRNHSARARDTGMDLVRILTRVNRQVATDYASYTPTQPSFDMKKQVSSIVSMLTRELYLTPKKK